MLEIWANAISY